MAVNINVPSQVKTFANLAAFPASGAVKTIYIAEDTNKTYRWDGSTYVEISASAATGLTIGTTPISSGTIGRVLFEGTGNVLQQSANFFWDSTNNRLGIGGTPGAFTFDVNGTARVNGSSFFATTSGTLVSGTTTIVNMNYGEVPKTYLTGGTFMNGTVQFPTTLRVIATGGGIQFAQQSAPSPNSNLFFGNDSSGVYYGNYGTLGVRFLVGATAQMTLASTTGNVLINTTTDAGFRLDVNGTARVKGDFVDLDSGNNERFKITDNAVSGNAYTFLRRFDNTKDIFHVIFPSGTLTTSNVNWNFGIKGNTNNFSIASYDGGASATERLVITNTGNVLIGTATNGASKLRVVGLPTSPVGLSSGDVWNNLGILTIV